MKLLKIRDQRIAPEAVKEKIEDIMPYIDRMVVWFSKTIDADLKTKLESFCKEIKPDNLGYMRFRDPITGRIQFNKRWQHKLDFIQPQLKLISYLNKNIQCDYLINYVEVTIDYTAQNKDDARLIRRFFDRYLVKKWHVSRDMVRIVGTGEVNSYQVDPDLYADIGTTYYVNDTRRNFRDFSIDEFNGKKYTVAKLCTAINGDKYRIQHKYEVNTIKWLNEILSSPKLYDEVRKKNGDTIFTEFHVNMKNTYDITTKSQSQKEDILKSLNRSLLETLYPDKTPRTYKKKPPIQLKVYSDRLSRKNSKPCCHIEVTFQNSKAVKNEGLTKFSDYLGRYFFRAFWKKYLDIRMIEEEDVIEKKIFEIMQVKKPDKNPRLLTSLYMKLFRLGGGILKAQNIIIHGKWIAAQRKFLRKINNDIFLP